MRLLFCACYQYTKVLKVNFVFKWRISSFLPQGRIFPPLWLQQGMQSSSLVNIRSLWTGMSDFFPTPLFYSLLYTILLYCKREESGFLHEILSFKQGDYTYCFVSTDSNLCCCKIKQSCSQMKTHLGIQSSYFLLWSHKVQGLLVLSAEGRSVTNIQASLFCCLCISTICRNERFSYCVF